MSPSLMMIHWKIFKLQSGHGLFLAILPNSRAITQKCFMGSCWLSNLAEIFCQQTFSQSLMIIQWKLFKCSHNTSLFSNVRIKRAYLKVTGKNNSLCECPVIFNNVRNFQRIILIRTQYTILLKSPNYPRERGLMYVCSW